MKAKRSIWTTLTGGLTSAAPILLSCCKSGACIGVCASPVASLFGISSATLASSPWIGVIEPVLIAISAVSFTVSYYSLYVLPKFNCKTNGGCDCAPTEKEIRRTKLNKFVFWFGLIASVGFLSYFEVQKYNAAKATTTECSTSSCALGECEVETTEECCAAGNSTACEK
ncbi:MAG: hypothetical protein SGJ15_10735 [Bacteroidota bacterium]|nr:hypothetical protein [Bacteroidota bacterium]